MTMDCPINHAQTPFLCRECYRIRTTGSVCPNCRNADGLLHSEIADLAIAHIDCDAFFAAIEKRDNPDLHGKPVIIGGGKRGVVATCCYTARLFGVRSAMPMFKALKACPNAIVVRPDFEKYKIASRDIRARMEKLTPLVQQVSIDEAYLDLSGTHKVHRAYPAELLSSLQREIERDVGITVSIGLSFNRFLAKSASELDKPNGFAVIGRGEARSFLATKPVEFVHGIGPAFARQIRAKGFETLGDLQSEDLKQLISKFGDQGLWLHQRALGIDNRPVDPRSDRKSISSETTFFEDISDPGLLEDHLWYLCEKTAFRAKETGLQGNVVTLKLKTSDFKTRTRRITLHQPTQLSHTLFKTGRVMLKKECDGARFRLLGIGISDLEPAKGDAIDLIDTKDTKRTRAERAADAAKARFGKDAISTGRGFRAIAKRTEQREQSSDTDHNQTGRTPKGSS